MRQQSSVCVLATLCDLQDVGVQLLSNRREMFVSQPAVAAACSGFLEAALADLVMAEASKLRRTFSFRLFDLGFSQQERLKAGPTMFELRLSCRLSFRPRKGCAVGPLCKGGRILLRPTNLGEEGKLLLRIKPEAGDAVHKEQLA